MRKRMVTKFMALAAVAMVGAGMIAPVTAHAEDMEKAKIRAEYDTIDSQGKPVHVIDMTTDPSEAPVPEKPTYTWEEVQEMDRLWYENQVAEREAMERGVTQEEIDALHAFVNRMYSVVLGREADSLGELDWSTRLVSEEAKAVDIVSGFFNSEEYKSKAKSNGEIVNDCYHAMLGRDADEAGYNDWVGRLNNGMSVNAILAGFVGSQEFSTLCQSYAIQPGTYTSGEARDWNIGATSYVSRLYTQALGRDYDIDGLNNWCSAIAANPSRENIVDVATTGFFHSQEFQNKGLNNEEYVKVLYRTFLGREAEPNGLADWVGQLDRGEKTRDEILPGFANSQEFSNIMAQYGL